jgi:hypothetical protein
MIENERHNVAGVRKDRTWSDWKVQPHSHVNCVQYRMVKVQVPKITKMTIKRETV